MKSFIYISVFALIFTLSTFTIQDAHAATVTAVQNGDWNDPATWDGAVPLSSYTVIIPNGITVIIPTGFTVTVDSTGVINNYGTINNYVSIDNYGTINNSGTINNWNVINNNTIIMNDGIINNNYGTMTNKGTMTNNGTIINFDTLDNYDTINNNHTITNWSAITNWKIIINKGTINNNSGTIFNSYSITNYNVINNNSSILNKGSITNPGIINNINVSNISNSGTIDNSGTISNYGTIDNINYGINYNPTRGTINNSGTIDNYGSIINNNSANIHNVVRQTLTQTPIIIDNSAGDQYVPHVSGDWVSYSSDLMIRYYNFATNTDAQIPLGLSANDLLSDISGSKIVFSRVITGIQTAIMVFDATTPSVAPIEIDAVSHSVRLGSAIGGNTVAYIDFILHENGELVVHDLVTSNSVRITNDVAFDQNPSVSPDGNVVTWEHCTISLGNCDIWQVVKNGATWHVGIVSNIVAAEGNPDTNGNVIVYDSIRGTDSDLFWRPVSGGAEVQISLPGFQGNPSIAGNFILFESRPTLFDTSDIFVYDMTTTNIYPISNTPLVTEQLNDIAVLPDGPLHIVWSSDEDGFDQRNVYGALLFIDKGIINNYDTITNYGNISNDGVINNLCGGTVNNSGTLTGNTIIYASCGIIPPDTTIIGSPSPTTSSSGATFAYTGNDDTTTASNLIFECSMDGGIFASCTSPSSYSSLTTGSHSFQVRAIDQDGNVDLIPASFSWTIINLTTTSCGTMALITDASGNTIITGTDSSGITIQISLPPGTTVPSDTLDVQCNNVGANKIAQVSGAVVPYPPGKSVTIPSGSNTFACIIDSPLIVSNPTCSATDTANSVVKMDCTINGVGNPVTQTFSGFPDSPTTRIYTCTQSNVGGQNYLKIDGLAFSTIVIDGTSPTVSFVGSINNGDSFLFGSVPDTPTCNATDDLSGTDGSCTVTGYSSTVGDHTLIATAKDGSGNVGTATLTYHVLQWTISGFYKPVDMSLIVNTIKNGQTAPMKFNVYEGTTSLTDPSVATFSQKQISCITGAVIDDLTITTTGDTSLRYDTTSSQFILNWQSPKIAGNCYDITVTTLDGSSITAHFKLK